MSAVNGGFSIYNKNLFFVRGVNMLLAAMIAINAGAAFAEEKAFKDKVAAMPEDQRAAAIKSRQDWQREKRRQYEQEQMVEAMKPHTLWSFLGLGRK